MTEDEKELCAGLVQFDAKPELSNEEFLRRFPSAVCDGKVSLALLEKAYRERQDEDLECAMIVGFAFGFGPEHLEILCRLVDEPWHLCHEDVVSALDHMHTPAALDSLFRATQWIPEYLDFDEARALAVKAIWGLGNLHIAEADAKLRLLTESENSILRENAKKQLRRGREFEELSSRVAAAKPNGQMSPTNAACWLGYITALSECGWLAPEDHRRLREMLPRLDSDPTKCLFPE